MPKKNEVETIKNFLDDLWKQAQGMLSKGRVSTSKVAQTAKLKMDLYLLAGKKDDIFTKLGEAFYATTKRKKASGKYQDQIMSLLKEAKEIESHEKSLKKSIAAAEGKVVKKPGRRGRPPKKKTARKRRKAEKPAA